MRMRRCSWTLRPSSTATRSVVMGMRRRRCRAAAAPTCFQMVQLGFGIDLPPADVTSGKVLPGKWQAGDAESMPLVHTKSGPKEPAESFAAVRYKDNWYWIDEIRHREQAHVHVSHDPVFAGRDRPGHGSSCGDGAVALKCAQAGIQSASRGERLGSTQPTLSTRCPTSSRWVPGPACVSPGHPDTMYEYVDLRAFRAFQSMCRRPEPKTR
jgi:hypothetical protein